MNSQNDKPPIEPSITILNDKELVKRGTSKLRFILRKVTAIIHALTHVNQEAERCETCGDYDCEYFKEERDPYWAKRRAIAVPYQDYRQRIKALLETRPDIPSRKKKK